MYRSFLHPRIGDSWNICTEAAEDAFVVYRDIRKKAGKEFTSSQKFLGQAYQIFSVAVAIAALLIVERSVSSAVLRSDIEMAIADLGTLDTRDTTVLLAHEGRKVLARMLAIHDQQGASSPDDAQELVPGISTVFGGEQSARSYMKRVTIRDLLNQVPDLQQQQLQSMSAHMDDTMRGDHDIFQDDFSQQIPFDGYLFHQLDSDISLDELSWWPAELLGFDSTM